MAVSIDCPRCPVETPLGQIILVMPDVDYFYCDGSGGVRINGVEYAAWCRLYFNGKWDIRSYGDVAGTRMKWNGTWNGSNLTPAAQKQFKEVCIKAVAKYFLSYPDTRRLAWEAKHDAEITAAAQAVVEANEALKAKMAEVDRLRALTYQAW